MSARPLVICLTPVKNEAWILHQFLTCASVWADVIIVADQGSDDDSREIAKQFGKVRLVANDSPDYDEGRRQQLLLDTAREYPGPRVLVALDADEVFLPAFESPDWLAALAAPPGTVLEFPWLAIGPRMATAWLDKPGVPFGFVDDGSPHTRGRIHNTRVPVPEGAPVVLVDSLPVLHLQYVSWGRMKAKQRWYQAWETLHLPDKRPAMLYRQYHHMDTALRRAAPFSIESLAAYGTVDWESLFVDPSTTFHMSGLAEMVAEHGAERFRRVDVWDAPALGAIRDPRSMVDRAALWSLARTQPFAGSGPVRLLDRALALVGW